MAARKTNSQQESFDFVTAPKLGPDPKPPFDSRALFRLAAEGIFLGTSSWKYRGWEGMIYRGGYASEAQFQKQSLREYTSLLPCVGVDFTFYTWPMPDMMSYLVDATPENFRCFPKVTKRITLEEFPNVGSYGKWAGQKNPEFLNVDAFQENFLKPISILDSRLGAIFFEFTHLEEKHLPQLEKFFSSIPRTFQYGVELRSPALVKAKFYSMLQSLEVAPIFNSWTKMPTIGEQFKYYLAGGGEKSRLPLVARGLLRPGRSYEEAVRLFQPYQQIKDEFPEFRADLVKLMRFARESERKAYILINNRLEGSAPHTIGALLKSL